MHINNARNPQALGATDYAMAYGIGTLSGVRSREGVGQ